jgi:predicted negative regulator of RcsB-dependent stress response
MVASFFLRFWKQIVIALVVLGAVWWVRNLYTTVQEQEITIATQQTTIKSLSDSIEEQNKAVQKLKTDSDARLAAANVALAAAQAKVKVNKQRAVDIGKATPKFPNDLCRSADSLINEEIK